MPKHGQHRREALAAVTQLSDSLFLQLPSIIRDLGFEYWCFSVIDMRQGGRALFYHSNFPRVWLDRYVIDQLHTDDPLREHALQSLAPLHWDPLPAQRDSRLWQALEALCVTQGMTQGCHHPCGLAGVLSLARPAPLLAPAEFAYHHEDLLCLAHQLTLASIELSLEEVACDEAEYAAGGQLTRRQVAVLQRAAYGETACEIGLALTLSVRTVQFHIKEAIVSLGVANKTAAVAQAVFLGLIRAS